MKRLYTNFGKAWFTSLRVLLRKRTLPLQRLSPNSYPGDKKKIKKDNNLKNPKGTSPCHIEATCQIW